MTKNNAINDEDKIIIKKYILNKYEKYLEVSTRLVLKKEICVVAYCGYVNSSRLLEHR
jgi:hypothetical protein